MFQLLTIPQSFSGKGTIGMPKQINCTVLKSNHPAHVYIAGSSFLAAKSSLFPFAIQPAASP
jgi:hypothetical protein